MATAIRAELTVLLCLAAGLATGMPAAAATVASQQDSALSLAPGTVSVSSIQATSPGAGGLVETRTATLYSGTTQFLGSLLNRFVIEIPAAGQLTVRLDDLNFEAATSLLSFALVQGSQVIDTLDGPGVLNLELGQAGTMYAYVWATSSTTGDWSSYYLDISHQFEQPVPLPAGVWLLLGGMGLLGWAGRIRRV